MTGAGYIGRNRYLFPELDQQQREANDQARRWMFDELRVEMWKTLAENLRTWHPPERVRTYDPSFAPR